MAIWMKKKGAGHSDGSADQKDIHTGLSGPSMPVSFFLSFFLTLNITCALFFLFVSYLHPRSLDMTKS